MHSPTMPGSFFSWFFYCRHAVHTVGQSARRAGLLASSTKEQLMQNCRCIIAEHAAEAAAAAAATPAIAAAAAEHKEAINGAQMRLACIKMLSLQLRAAKS